VNPDKISAIAEIG
jgi:dsDNA-binding SOS-regulon protein